MKPLKYFSIIFILVFAFKLEGQSINNLSADVKEILNTDQTFEEMATKVESYYDANPHLKDEGEYKKWARWAYYMSMHTSDRGYLTDIQKMNTSAYQSFSSSEGRASVGNWISRGPSVLNATNGSGTGMGRVDRIAFHPTDSDIIYAGSSGGGLFKTTNGGDSWQAMTDAIGAPAISGIVVSHANSNIIYILTGDGDSSGGGFVNSSGYIRSSKGVYVSYDAGINWQHKPLPINVTYYGYRLAQNPVNENELVAATDRGLYRTLNGGSSWDLVSSVMVFYDVAFKPGSSTIGYAVTNNNVFRTQNGFTSITEVTNISPAISSSVDRLELAVTPANSSYVYVYTATDFSSSDPCSSETFTLFNGLYRSSDSGASFDRRDDDSVNPNSSCCLGGDTRTQSTYDHAMAVSNVNVNNLALGGIVAWRSTNGGQSFIFSHKEQDDCAGITGFIHDDIHELAYQPVTNRLFAATDGGVYFSDNNGATWGHKNNGLIAGQIYHLGVSNSNKDVMMIGLQDNGTRAKSLATSLWNATSGADGFDVQYKWNSESTGFVSINRGAYEFTSNGDDRTTIVNNSSEPFFKRMCGAINNVNEVFIGSTEIREYNKVNSVWIEVNSLSAAGNMDIERCPSNANRFYFAGGTSYFSTTSTLRRTDDKFETSTLLDGSISQRVTDIAVRPNNSNEIWFCLGGYTAADKVFRSTNTGSNFTNMTDNLPNVPVISLAIDDNGDAYAGTDIGVFFRSSTMTEWIPFSNDLPIVPVTDIEISQNKIIASTFGRGVWESDLFSPCGNIITMTSNMKDRQIFEASQTINGSYIVYGGANSDITFKSGNEIVLTPGFAVFAHSNFRGYIKPCGEF